MPTAPFVFAHCDQPLPCPPGTSRFHIKGEFYCQLLGVIDDVERKSQGALTPLLAAAGLLDFVRQRFLASTLYDILPLPRIFMALARALDRDVAAFTDKLGRASVESQMNGTYRSLFANMSTDNFVHRFPLMTGHLYDFGPATVTLNPGDASATLYRTGIPLCTAEWWCLVAVPFLKVPLEANGAQGVNIQWRIAATGETHGIAMGEAHWDIRWQGTSTTPAR